MKKYEAMVIDATAIAEDKLDKLDKHAHALAKALNVAPGDEGEMSAKEREKANKELRELKDSYNEAAEKLAYLTWAQDAETPQECMEMAMRAINIPGIKNASVRYDKRLGVYVAKIDDAKPAPSNRVNLINLQKTLGIECFNKENWFDYVQALALLFVQHMAKEMDVGTYSYETNIAETFSFGDKADPTSKGSMVKALQETVDAIYFVPMTKKNGTIVNAIKIDGRDYTYLKEAFSKEGNEVSSIVVKDTQNAARLIAQIIHTRLEGGTYMMSVG